MSCIVLQYRIDFAESVVPGFNDLLIIFFIQVVLGKIIVISVYAMFILNIIYIFELVFL